MKKTLLALAAVATLGSSTAAFAQSEAPGPYLVRLRAVNLHSDNNDNTNLGLSLSNKVIPEVDLSYFFTPNIAAELILTYPQKHDLRSYGKTIGTLKELPPTLLAQYHFTDFGPIKPYLGAGINYTRLSNFNLPAGVSADKSSWGVALQAGVDYALDKNWLINVDLKKVYIATDVSSNGTKLGTFKVDPWLFGVGVGYRF